MKATLNKHLHERALGIIEMIQDADQRIKCQKQNIERFEGHFLYTTGSCEEKIKSLEGAKDRLEKSYQETIKRINKAIN